MKFGQPLLTSELAGSMAGVTASSARGGQNYFRVRARPGNPRTVEQSTVRSVLSTLAGRWLHTLTALQRSGWEAIASGISSGINAYIKGNAQPGVDGEAYTDAPPTSLALPTATIATAVVVDASAHSISVTVPDAADVTMNCYVSRQQSPSRAAQQFGFTFVDGVTIDGAGGTAVFNIPVTHPAYNLTVGQAIYVRVVEYGDPLTAVAGQVAVGQEFRVLVTA